MWVSEHGATIPIRIRASDRTRITSSFGPAYRVNVITGSSLANSVFAAQAAIDYNTNRTGIYANTGGDFLGSTSPSAVPSAKLIAASMNIDSVLRETGDFIVMLVIQRYHPPRPHHASPLLKGLAQAIPPLTLSTCPLIQRLPSPLKKCTTSAISSGVPIRLAGLKPAIILSICSLLPL